MTYGSPIQAIFVPQGWEYQAVNQGLKFGTPTQPNVVQIPMGSNALMSFLQQWMNSQPLPLSLPKTILFMGVCGSSSPQYRVGDVVLYQSCVNVKGEEIQCDRNLTHSLSLILNHQGKPVKGFTSDRIIHLPQEKHQIRQRFKTDVIDMEGFTLLKFFQSIGINVAIIRVISDECNQTLPNLSSAIQDDGTLQPLSLTLAFAKNPIAAFQLIRSSLQALKQLQNVTKNLF